LAWTSQIIRSPGIRRSSLAAIGAVALNKLPNAIVVVREDLGLASEALALELRAHCRTYIAGYKVPKQIEIQQTPLPKSGPGKVLKRTLREKFRSEVGAPSANDRASEGKAS